MDPGSLGLQILGRHVCHDAMQPYPVHRNFEFRSRLEIRTEVIQQISAWLDDGSQTSQILLVCGAAGSGKTFIAQTVANSYRTSKRLGGSFFIRRGLKAPANGNHLIPTIAYQLATNIPELQRSISDVVRREENLPFAPFSDQFHSLVVRPIQDLDPPLSTPLVIIIDGLDEYNADGDTQQGLLRSLADSLTHFELPLRFLITSRPESPICQAFDSEMLKTITHRIRLPSLHPNVIPSSQLNQKILSPVPTRKRRPRCIKRPFEFTSYPRIVTLRQKNGHEESYCRALLSAGNGFPLWRPSGNLSMPVGYLKKGVNIGDIGIVDMDGSFQYFFNIFRTPDDPINAGFVPREFHPIEPNLQHSELVYKEEHFKPGHVETSKGIAIDRRSESPLDICFTSTESEGAILILPCGASREDLISTSRFHEYARKNAPHWYQFINNYGGITTANGSLFLVTGCDKAVDWAIASFPYRAGNTTDALDLRYTWRPGYKSPWTNYGTADTDFYAPNPNIPDEGKEKNQCIFVRGLRISLTQQSWLKTLPYVEQARLHYSFILHEPSKFYLWFDAVLVFFRLRLSEKRAVDIVSVQNKHLFHPNFIISQVLLAEYPDAELALVDDSVWCSLVDSGSDTISDMNELVTKVIGLNEIIERQGVISLRPKTSEEHEQPRASRTTFRLFSRNPPTKKKPGQWVKSVPVYRHAKLF